jgi:streptogramin lyase
LGQNLQRPECILTEPNGTVWAADARGGLVKMRHDGTQELLNPFTVENISSAPNGDDRNDKRYIQAQGSLPNGVCFDKNGEFIIANWGTNHIEKLSRTGSLSTLVTEIDGRTTRKS